VNPDAPPAAPTSPLNGDRSAVVVRGAPTSDEIAAVLTALTRRASVAEDPYERWRRGRIAAHSRGADTR
jgi:hypothetical protein